MKHARFYYVWRWWILAAVLLVAMGELLGLAFTAARHDRIGECMVGLVIVVTLRALDWLQTKYPKPPANGGGA